MEPDCSKAEKQQAFRTLQKVSFIFTKYTIEANVCIRILLFHKVHTDHLQDCISVQLSLCAAAHP